MSQADSFIDEVNDEVRRDKLYGTLRKYGWIGILSVVVIVGGAAWNEYRKASAKAEAEALGDSLLAALEQPTAEVRISQLQALTTDGEMQSVLNLLTAAESLAFEDPAAAIEALRPVATNTALPLVYSDLAAFKMVLIGDEALAETERAQVLDRLSQAGGPYRNLAMEQKALDLAAAGETEAAIEAARALLEEPALTPGLLQRMAQLIVALGGDIADDAG